MRALRGIDGSICGAILATRPPALAATASVKPQHGERSGATSSTRRPNTRHSCSSRANTITTTPHCPRTTSWLLSTFLPDAPITYVPCQRSLQSRTSRQQTRNYSHAAAATSPSPQPPLPRFRAKPEELLAMVDERDAGTVEEHLDLVRDPYMRRYARPDGPALIVSDKRSDANYPTHEEAIRGDPRVQQVTEKLRLALSQRQRQPARVPLRKIHSLYYALPQPRMLNLPAPLRHRLLKAMGKPTKRNSASMLRYFGLIEEVKDTGLTLQRREWNSALAFASQYVGNITDTEAETVLQLWSEMEKSGGQKANAITFNILFDAAAKSGNIVLAEKIYAEMESRGLEFNRYHRVSLIHFFGLKEDADGVRAAYKEMVEAGEMIDTVVLNCLIASFLRAGDTAAALRVYDHMKQGSSSDVRPPLDDRKMNKFVTELLMMFSKVGRSHPDMLSSFQEQTPISPNFHTYRILLYHYAWTVGDLVKVSQFLEEMQWLNVPVHGSIYLTLFKGFAKHGGGHHTPWTEERLRRVYSSLLQALNDEKTAELYVDTWLVGWALRAFMKCAGRDAVLEVYDELQTRWTLNESRAAHVQEYLHEVLRGVERNVFTHEEASRRIRKTPR